MGGTGESTAAGKPGNLAKCDICGATLDRADGYCVSTEKIAVSESYWRRLFARLKQEWEHLHLHLDERQQVYMFMEMANHQASSATPWLLCENCSEFTVFDRRQARRCAVSGIDPEGNGPVELGECVMFAAMAWEHVFGRWPATVEQPNVAESCDLCAKKIYYGEVSGAIGRTAMERFRRIGVIDSAPLSPPRASTGRWAKAGQWVICAPCMAKNIARLARAGYGST